MLQEYGTGAGGGIVNSGSGSNTGYSNGRDDGYNRGQTGSGNSGPRGVASHIPGTKDYKAAHGRDTSDNTGSGHHHHGSRDTGAGTPMHVPRF